MAVMCHDDSALIHEDCTVTSESVEESCSEIEDVMSDIVESDGENSVILDSFLLTDMGKTLLP